MSISAQTFCVAVVATFVGAILPAHAGLSISKAATLNVACHGGRCIATAADAILNVKDLQTLLATKRDVQIHAAVAKDITVDAALIWTSGAALSLSGHGQLSVNKPITVAGHPVTASGHPTLNIESKGMVFAPKANIAFLDTTSALTINGQAYVLIGDLNTLFNITPPGFYALTSDCDGTTVRYEEGISQFGGVFDGLGHTISNLYIFSGNGMFQSNFGIIRNLNLVHATLNSLGGENGFLVGGNAGTVDHASVTGAVSGQIDFVGGLVGTNIGTITNSNARVKIFGLMAMGGLAAYNGGTISASYAESDVQENFDDGPNETGYGGLVGINTSSGKIENSYGGLVGINSSPGKIENSYSLTRLRGMNADSWYGGLVGWSAGQSSITGSYAAGEIEKHGRSGGHPGGITGFSSSLAIDGVCIYRNVTASSCGAQPTFSNTYWDLDDGVSNPAHGAANAPNHKGITGLTDAQLKSGLPAGFDPKIWAQSPSINNGYPYLRSNPPQ